MAALRHGVRTVIIPSQNERDLELIDQTVRKSLNFITAQTVDTVLEAALVKPNTVAHTGLLAGLPEDVQGRHKKPEIRQ